MIEPILIVVIAVVCTVLYMRHLRHRRWRRARTLATRPMTGLELLNKRYASGDIDRDEYLQMRDDILRHSVASQPRVDH